jgi:Mn2+/Fe2+ NRAMP family transporter
MSTSLPPTRAQKRRRTAGWLLLCAVIVAVGIAMATMAFGFGGHDPGFEYLFLCELLVLVLITLAALFFLLSFFGKRRHDRYS